MQAPEALRVLRLLVATGVPAWVAGGWGVDALVGEQTRAHDDLDICFDAAGEGRAILALDDAGYHLGDDWRPVRFVMADGAGHTVDLHPVAFDAIGDGVQANLAGQLPFVYPAQTAFATGRIAGVPVACLSSAQQVIFHLGYQPKEKDRRDMGLLSERLGVCWSPSSPE